MGTELELLPLRKKCRIKIFANRLLRRIFEAETGEVTGGWRKLYNMGSFVFCILHLVLFG
jgi:hypothetical protein